MKQWQKLKYSAGAGSLCIKGRMDLEAGVICVFSVGIDYPWSFPSELSIISSTDWLLVVWLVHAGVWRNYSPAGSRGRFSRIRDQLQKSRREDSWACTSSKCSFQQCQQNSCQGASLPQGMKEDWSVLLHDWPGVPFHRDRKGKFFKRLCNSCSRFFGFTADSSSSLMARSDQ